MIVCMEGEPQLIHKMGGGLGSYAPFADFSSTGLGSAQGPLASAVGRGAVALKWFSREGGDPVTINTGMFRR